MSTFRHHFRQIKANKSRVARVVSQGLAESWTQARSCKSVSRNLKKSENYDRPKRVDVKCEQAVASVASVDNSTMPSSRETRSSLKLAEGSTTAEMSLCNHTEASATEDRANNNNHSKTACSPMDSTSTGHKGRRKLVEVSATGIENVESVPKLNPSKAQTLNIELSPKKGKARSDVSCPTVHVYPGEASKQLRSVDKKRKQLQQLENRIVSPRLQMQKIQNIIKLETDEANSKTSGPKSPEKEKSSFSCKKRGKNNSDSGSKKDLSKANNERIRSAGKGAKKRRDSVKKAVTKSSRSIISPSVDGEVKSDKQQQQQAEGSRNLFDTFFSLSPTAKTGDEDEVEVDASDNNEFCHHCELAFTTKARYENHMRYRHSKELKKQTELKKERQIIREMKRKSIKYSVKSATNTVKCTVCFKMLASKQTLRTHMNIHLGLKPHVCKECGHAFCDYGSLARHLRMHKGVRSYKCKICSQSFSQRSGLSHHMNVHGSIRPYKCHICDKAFTQKPHRDKHIRAIHTKERTDVCEVCHKAFPDRWKLSQHMRIHTNEKPYACHICKNKRFSDSSNYRLHMRYHSGERPYACPHCDKTFIQTIDLKRHLPQHGGVRPYICKLCDHETYIEQNMQRHVCTHFRDSPKKKFKCSICDKSFVRNSTLSRHVHDMHPELIQP